MIKSAVRDVLPSSALRAYRQLRRLLESRRNGRRSLEEVFTKIYLNNKWGGSPGEFVSGSGSLDEQLVNPYVDLVRAFSERERLGTATFVDLGCGDFRVGRRLSWLRGKYLGVDIVRPLIDRNNREFGNSTVKFMALDIVRDPLPFGDVCMLRQVLQHLSNAEICCVLEKLKQYAYVLITEHYPIDETKINPNLDKVHGPDIRLEVGSGVYLSQAPFNVPDNELSCVLALPVRKSGRKGSEDFGVLRTYLYTPGMVSRVRDHLC